MKTTKIIELLKEYDASLPVYILHGKKKYGCSSMSNGGERLFIFESSTPYTVEDVVDSLLEFTRGGDSELVFVYDFALLDEDKKTDPVDDVLFDGESVFLFSVKENTCYWAWTQYELGNVVCNPKHGIGGIICGSKQWFYEIAPRDGWVLDPNREIDDNGEPKQHLDHNPEPPREES